MATVERLTAGQVMFLQVLTDPDAQLCQRGQAWGIEIVGNDAPVKVLSEHAEWAVDRGYVTRLDPQSQREPRRFGLSDLGRGLL